jgi:hypothetical protein
MGVLYQADMLARMSLSTWTTAALAVARCLQMQVSIMAGCWLQLESFETSSSITVIRQAWMSPPHACHLLGAASQGAILLHGFRCAGPHILEHCHLTCCPYLQGTLRQWAPVGALLSLMWVMPCISQGVPVAHALLRALAMWVLSYCVAAGLETWQRTSYLQRKPRQGARQQGKITSIAGISRPQKGQQPMYGPGDSKKDK